MLKIYLQRRCLDGKSVHKKMFSIIDHWRNSNKRHGIYHFRFFNLKKNYHASKSVEQLDPTYSTGGNENGTITLQRIQWFLTNSTHSIHYSTTPLLFVFGICSKSEMFKNICSDVHPKLYTWVAREMDHQLRVLTDVSEDVGSICSTSQLLISPYLGDFIPLPEPCRLLHKKKINEL